MVTCGCGYPCLHRCVCLCACVCVRVCMCTKVQNRAGIVASVCGWREGLHVCVGGGRASMCVWVEGGLTAHELVYVGVRIVWSGEEVSVSRGRSHYSSF